MVPLVTRILTELLHVRPIPRVLVAGIALSALALQATRIAIASPAGTPQVAIPAQDYPTGAHLAYIAHMSNHRLDCAWGFLCEGGVPLYHFHTQDHLHRATGWAQYAGWRQGHRYMQFALFVSRYQDDVDVHGIPWSRVAMVDLAHALAAHGFTPLPGTTPFSAEAAIQEPITVDHEMLTEVEHPGPYDTIISAQRIGPLEVEAIVVVSHGGSLRDTAVRFLERQTRAAIRSSV